MIYFTSDLHIAHKNILKYQPVRREKYLTTSEMTEGIVSEWNNRVTNNDTVYFLGDFSLVFKRWHFEEKAIPILERLNGNIVWILGNHDNRYYIQEYAKQNSNVSFYGNYHEFKINDQWFVLCHYPFEVWNRCHYGSIHLHGHVHDGLRFENEQMKLNNRKRLDIGWDSYDRLTLWSIDEILEHFN